MTTPCPQGLYCDRNGTCAADCTLGTATDDCGRGSTCTSTGMCQDVPIDGGRLGRDGSSCASIALDSHPMTPNVMMIVDRSESMDTKEFPPGSGETRWVRLRDELLKQPDGLIKSREASVRFGISLYNCSDLLPFVESEAMALKNYDKIASFWRMREPGANTPTGPAIDAVVADIKRLTPSDTRTGEPTIFVLATDGEPNLCEATFAWGPGRTQALKAVKDAFTAGFRTFVISVGDEIGQDHLQAMANAGVSASPGTNAPFWVATDTVTLGTALDEIVGGVTSCTLKLDGQIDPNAACKGSVSLDARPLPCDDQRDGWRAVDGTHIELLGAACDEFLRTGGNLSAVFPCDVVMLI